MYCFHNGLFDCKKITFVRIIQFSSRAFMKPKSVLLFFVSVMGILGILMFIFPESGIQISNNLTLRFPSFNSLFSVQEETVDITQIVDLKREDLLADNPAAPRQLLNLVPLEFPSENPDVLSEFFEQLDSLRKFKHSLVRVMHYGDSQIEGDRISGYLRDRLQEMFGGSGAGIAPALQPIPSRAIAQSSTENWSRYSIFGMIEQKAEHNRYGAMLSFCKYTGDTAMIQFKKSSIGFARNRNINKITIYYGACDTLLQVKLIINGQYEEKTLQPTQSISSVQFESDVNSNTFDLEFQGKSPEIYGICLDGGNGITVDNMPMRGSSGNRFTAVEPSGFAKMHKMMNTRLIIMEFGGNAMPEIKSKEEALRYGNSLYNQFAYVKRHCPQASVIAIGPADMSKKIDGKMVSYPYLTDVRDAIKQSAFKAGCAYWDMYEAMGGHNSMPAWVEAQPPLAGPDYIHFTPFGAEKIGELLTKALINAYKKHEGKTK